MRSGSDKGRSFIEAARRAQIVATAEKVVAELGYARASLAKVAERAGISKSVILYHFDGKQDLLAQVAGEFFEEAWKYMEPRILAEPTATGQVAAWITAELEHFAAHRQRFLAMTEVVTNHRAPDGTRPFANDEDEELDGMAAVLAAGQASGELRHFDPSEVAAVIIRSIEGVLGAWAMDESVDLLGHADALVDFVLHAIVADPTGLKPR